MVIMKCLVTAGNTLAPIDSVRGITNIFSGRTGAQIALELHRGGHDVVLLTSRPETIMELAPKQPLTLVGRLFLIVFTQSSNSR